MYRLKESSIKGCFEIFPVLSTDNRGTVIKPFNKDQFKELSIEHSFTEDLVVHSPMNVLRGLHFQIPPYAQVKLVYCVLGSIMDVLLDLRKGSDTYGKSEIFYLNDAEKNMLYVPQGIAHGYCTLADKNIVCYKLNSLYSREHDAGIRWDSLDIPWPVKEPIISEKDKKLPLFKDFISMF